ncbi:hypothetical protein X737_39000 [Mesorhizobium sp. L48C026A00]|nr:hypothetical protein X737_39000 [Mesorhizobium sp. L48C026A00]
MPGFSYVTAKHVDPGIATIDVEPNTGETGAATPDN